LKKEDEEREDDFEDEIKPEDGLLRYWIFFNGEQYRLFAALAAVFLGVLWCFLYGLGAGQTILGIILGALAVISLIAWRTLDQELQKYATSRWKKDKHSPRRVRIELRVVILLWLFIFIVASITILSKWRHGH
jgi:hypothetical protein